MTGSTGPLHLNRFRCIDHMTRHRNCTNHCHMDLPLARSALVIVCRYGNRFVSLSVALNTDS